MKRIHALSLGLAGLAVLAARAQRSNYSFRGKRVLITGGSRGLGLEIARLLAREGAHIALCARRTGEIKTAESELKKLGVPVQGYVCDLRMKEQIESLIEQVRIDLGPIDVLIHNAGVIEVGPQEVMGEEDFRNALDVHFWGAYHTTSQVLPEMLRRKRGKIVHIASVGGKVPPPHLLPYTASKYALAGYSEGLGVELRKKGIHVTTVIPGLMRTGSIFNALFKGDHNREFSWFALSDSMPGISISSSKAARQIVEACREGKAELTLTWAAKAAVAAHGIAPNLTLRLFSLADRLLPRSAESEEARRTVPGKYLKSKWALSPLTVLSQRAAFANNELRSSWMPGTST